MTVVRAVAVVVEVTGGTDGERAPLRQAVTPQPLHSHRYTATVTQQPLRSNRYTITATKQPSHSIGAAPPGGLQRMRRDLLTTLRPLHPLRPSRPLRPLRQALFNEWRVIYGAFDYYAISSTTDAIPKHGEEPDIYNITSNGYYTWLREGRIIGDKVPSRVADLIFVQASAPVGDT